MAELRPRWNAKSGGVLAVPSLKHTCTFYTFVALAPTQPVCFSSILLNFSSAKYNYKVTGKTLLPFRQEIINSTMATYNLTMTSKASSSIASPSLFARLISSHRRFDPSMPSSAIKIIEIYLSNSYGIWLHIGTNGVDQQNYRYIRVVIDVPASTFRGDSGPQRKRELLQRTLECCQGYEGKKAADCEYEVRVNEVENEDVLRVAPTEYHRA